MPVVFHSVASVHFKLKYFVVWNLTRTRSIGIPIINLALVGIKGIIYRSQFLN